ncbi:hypothetical protein V8F20_006286 [Naviculisporaceae sp. PSN 640]
MTCDRERRFSIFHIRFPFPYETKLLRIGLCVFRQFYFPSLATRGFFLGVNVCRVIYQPILGTASFTLQMMRPSVFFNALAFTFLCLDLCSPPPHLKRSGSMINPGYYMAGRLPHCLGRQVWKCDRGLACCQSSAGAGLGSASVLPPEPKSCHGEPPRRPRNILTAHHCRCAKWYFVLLTHHTNLHIALSSVIHLFSFLFARVEVGFSRPRACVRACGRFGSFHRCPSYIVSEMLAPRAGGCAQEIQK